MTEPTGGEKRRHVIVSGGSRGLGRALVAGLIESGYQVSTFSRNRTDFIDQHAEDPRLFFELADVCDSPGLVRFLNSAKERFGPPYGLVNCAGVAIVGVLPLLRDEQIDQAIATNLRGTITLTRLVLRQMRFAWRRRIDRQYLFRGRASRLSRHGGLFRDQGRDGRDDPLSGARTGGLEIRVNSVAPGYLQTEMSSSLNDQQRKDPRSHPSPPPGHSRGCCGPGQVSALR